MGTLYLEMFQTANTSSDFNEMLITAYVNKDNYLHEVAAKPKLIREPKKSSVISTTNYDEMLVIMALEKMPAEMAGFSKKYESWRNVGWILKNTFENEQGWDLFDRFSKLGTDSYDFVRNRELWDSWKTKDEVENPLGMGSLIEMLKKENKQLYADIQKEVKSKKNMDVKKAAKDQE